jgi:hypothetical protein
MVRQKAPGPQARRALRRRVRVIFCYAHHDEKQRDELNKHLAVLRRGTLIEIWYDQQITPGDELDREILGHLQDSDLVLLLITPDFMNSNYCYCREMRIALRRHAEGRARVIPIILRPVDWLRTPIGKLLALPKNGRPVTTWRRKDEALLDVAKGVRRAAEEMAKKSGDVSNRQLHTSSRRIVRASADR